MKIKLKAPYGYKYHDTKTDRDYSEIIVDEKERDRFTLVPAPDLDVVEINKY